MALRTSSLPIPSSNKTGQVSNQTIRAIVDHIAAHFKPEQIVLFGSYAYGNPEPWSDLDLLIVIDAPEGEMEKALAIRKNLPPYPFTIDVIVRSRETLEKRKKLGDWFLQEITKNGKVIYERANERMGQQGSSFR